MMSAKRATHIHTANETKLAKSYKTCNQLNVHYAASIAQKEQNEHSARLVAADGDGKLPSLSAKCLSLGTDATTSI